MVGLGVNDGVAVGGNGGVAVRVEVSSVEVAVGVDAPPQAAHKSRMKAGNNWRGIFNQHSISRC